MPILARQHDGPCAVTVVAHVELNLRQVEIRVVDGLLDDMLIAITVRAEQNGVIACLNPEGPELLSIGIVALLKGMNESGYQHHTGGGLSRALGRMEFDCRNAEAR